MESLFYEDFVVGAVRKTPVRTLTDADITAFAEVSGDRNPLHLDDEYAATTIFGGRIAHGLLGLAVASGLVNRSKLTAGTLVALMGVNWKFRRPLRPGDSVRVAMKVLAKRPTRNPERGFVRLGLRLLDQHDDVAQEGSFALLVRRRGDDGP